MVIGCLIWHAAAARWAAPSAAMYCIEGIIKLTQESSASWVPCRYCCWEFAPVCSCCSCLMSYNGGGAPALLLLEFAHSLHRLLSRPRSQSPLLARIGQERRAHLK